MKNECVIMKNGFAKKKNSFKKIFHLVGNEIDKLNGKKKKVLYTSLLSECSFEK